MKRVLRFIWKLFKWLLISAISLFLLLAILLYIPPVQKFLLQKGTQYFNEQTGGNLTVNQIDLRLPFYLQLEGINLNSPSGDKIASIGEIEISIGWRKIFSKTIRLDDIHLEDVDAAIRAEKDGNWNYQFIVDGFSSDETTPPDTAQKATWDVSLSQIRLKNIQFIYENALSGDTLRTDLGRFYTEFQRASIMNQVFLADEIELSHTDLYFSMGKRPETADTQSETEESESELIFSLNSINLDDIETYANIPGSGVFDVKLGELKLLVNKFNLDLNRYLFDDFTLNNTVANISVPESETEEAQGPTNVFLDLILQLKKCELNNNQLYLNLGQDSLSHHLNLNKFSAREIEADSSQYAIDVDELDMFYNDYPQLKNLSANLLLSDNQIRIDQLKLIAGKSEIDLDLGAKYPSFQKAMDEYIFNQASLNLKKIELHQSDLNELKSQFLDDDSLPSFDSDISARAFVESNGKNLRISPFKLRYGQSVLNAEILKYSLDFNQYGGEIKALDFKLGSPLRDQLTTMIGMESLEIPESLELSIQGKNLSDSAEVDMNIYTSAGNIDLEGKSSLADTASIPVEIMLESDGFRIGEVLTSSPDAFVKFQLNASSENVLKFDSVSHAHLSVDTVFYEIPLENIQADLSALSGLYQANIAVRDTFIDTDVDVEFNNADALNLMVDAKVNGIDLQGLGLSKSDIRGKTSIYASYSQNESFETGQLEISGTTIIQESEVYDLKPLLGQLYFSEDTTDIELSGMVNAFSRSNRDIQSILKKLPSLINQTYQVDNDTGAVWIAEVDIGEAPILREVFIPEITEFSGLLFKLDYSSARGYISADLGLPKLVYNDFFVDSLKLNTGSDSSRLSRSLTIRKLGYDTLQIDNLNILSLEDRDATSIRIQTTRDRDSLPNYLINCSFRADSANQNSYTFSLNDSLILNNEKWSIDKERLQFTDSTYYGNISINRGKERLSLLRENESDEFKIKAENFELVNLLSITQEDSLVSGTFTGSFTSAPNSFYGEGIIESFAILHSELGDLSWDFQRKDNTSVELSSKNGRLNFTTIGQISFPENSAPQLSIHTELQNLDLKMASELYPAYILDAKGGIQGKLDISGTTKEPVFDGSFRFKGAEISTVYTGSNLKIEDSKVDLTNEKIDLNTMALVDSAGRRLTIAGEIRNYQEELSDVDISIDSDDFTLVNVSPENAILVYGQLIADLNIKITQRLDAPKVRAKVKIDKGTDFTYKVPPDDDYETFDDDLIEWTNLDTIPSRDEILTREKERLNSTVDVFANTIDFNGEVEIVEEATLRVLIDSAAGDFLEIRGDAKISMDYNRAGNLRMIGNYYVADGFYQMNFYNISKKKFKLEEGGYVNWNGDAFNPSLKLSAIYTTRASLTNLMMTESNSTVNPAYQQALPFNVIMSIEGEVEEPEIAFDIRLDKENQGALNGAVDSRLSILRREESEMNKQVFSLLVFQTFMPSGSTSSPNLIENQARNSASQILSQELNKYGDQLIKGVDVNFDLQSYGGGQGAGNTDLTVDVAKSFFDNRVVVRVGSTIALEQNISTGNDDPFNTNVVVEYLITKDGRYRFLGYSKTNLEDIVVGRITRTGAGLVFQRDFDRFRYLVSPKSRPGYDKKETENKNKETEEDTDK